MNFLVCVKQVPDDFAKIHLGKDGNPDTASVSQVVNAFDTYAVEMAVRYTEAHGGKVVVLSLGDEQGVRPAVVQMISVGASDGFIGADAGKNADESVVAESLKEAIAKAEAKLGEKFDVVLCGKESTDKISSLVGGMLAEKLGYGYVSNIVDLEENGDGVKAKQETDEGFITYEASLPAVFSVGKPAYDPRYPNLKSKMKARKAVIPFLADLEKKENSVNHVAYSEPKAREGGIKIQEKEAAEAVAKVFAILDEHKVL